MKTNLRYFFTTLFCMILCFCVVPVIRAEAATDAEIISAMDSLQTRYPTGSHWTQDEFGGGWQCYAFARYLANEIFGSYPANMTAYSNGYIDRNGWTCVKDLNTVTVQPGDIIQTYTDGNNQHSAIVYKVSGNIIYVGECWSGSYNNEVHWGGYFNGTNSNATLSGIASKYTSTAVWKHPGGTIAPSVTPPQIISYSSYTEKNVGETASFTVTASGDNLSYQWQYRSDLNDDGYNISDSSYTGFRTPTLSFLATSDKHYWQFRCKVSNSAGTVYSPWVTLLVNSTFTGKWGNLNWTLDGNGLLTISGNGAMNNFDSSSYSNAWRAYRDQITAVKINSGVTSIGNYAFASCNNLTSIISPETLTSIGIYAFNCCSSLMGVTIPSGVTSIGSSAFGFCTSLMSIMIPNSVILIGDSAFYGCSNLKSIVIPNSVTSIGRSAFFDCRGLSSIIIPSSIKSIESSVFNRCDHMTSVTIPTSVTSIGDYAFWGCSGLVDVYYEGTQEQWNAISIGADNAYLANASIHYIGEIVSGTWGNLSWTLDNNGLLTVSGNGMMNEFPYNSTDAWRSLTEEIKSVYIEYGVTSISSDAFSGCTKLTSVTIPNSIRSIGKSAFGNCSLTSVIIPNGVICIGGFAFSGCPMTSITIPDSVTSFEPGGYFRNLQNIYVSTGNANFSSVNGVLFNKNKTILIEYPSGRTGSYSIPDGVMSIGEYAFYGSNLTSINIPNSVTSIGYRAFCSCWGLTTSLTIPNSVSTIGGEAFSGTNLTSVIISNNIRVVSEGAFNSSPNLKEVTIPNSVISIGSRAFGFCTSLTNISIPNSVTSIGGCAFYNCTNLISMTIPNGVTKIEDRTFEGCTNLASIFIPNSVTSIVSCAFRGCNSLTDVYYDGTAAQWNAINKGSENDPLLNATIRYGKYTVTFNANGGTGAPESQIKIQDVALTLSSGTPTRASTSAGSYTVTLNANGGSVSPTSLSAARTTSYTFKNWNTAANGSGTSYASGATYSTDANVTLYAQWTSNTTTSAVNLPTPTRDGWAFMGWATSNSATSGVTGSYTPNGNVTLYAVWKADSYTVIYNANGGTGAPANQTKMHGTALALSTTKPTRANTSAGNYTVTLNANGGSVNPTSLSAARTTSYTFKNWNTAANGSGTSYATGATYSTDADVTLYAQWTSSTTTATVSLPTPTRSGYTFKGWNTSSNATSGNTGSYTPSGNVTLYAIWEEGSTSGAASGTWDNLTWTLDTNGLLTISGSGTMKDLYTLNGKRVAWGSKADQIKKVVISNGITRIGDEAFRDCSILTSITIPSSVESIGTYAFYNCNNISNLSIPNSVKRFDDYAFYSCGSLKTLTLSGNVTSIDNYAFASCNNLTSVSFPSSVKSISDGVFCNCTKLKSFTIPEGTVSIGASAFANCSSLTGITIPSSVSSIGTAAFYGCTGMTDLTILARITSIGQSAFQNLTGLISVTISDSVESIGNGAFYGCSSLQSIVIPVSVTSVEYGAFLGCNSLTDVYYGGTRNQWNNIGIDDCNMPLVNATIHCEGETPTTYTVTYNANGGTGALADQIKTHGVALTLSTDTPTHSSSSAGSYTVTLNANSGSVNPTSLTASRTTSYTFKNWNTAANGSGTSYAAGATYSENADVTLYAQWNSNTTTEAVTLQTPTRDGYTFKGWNTSSSATSGVTGSYTPSGNVTLYAIWEETFVSSGTWGSLSWTLDANGLLTISGNGDMDNFNDSSTAAWRSKKSSVKSIIINSGITSIGDWAFNGCKYLKSVTIPESVTIIGEDAFSNCSGLTSVTIPEGVTNLSFCAFYGCSSLKSVTISNSVTILGDYAFSGCKGLKSITIPENVTSIGEYTFYRCSGLTSVTIPGSVTSLGGDAFADCSGLTSVTIQEGVTSLGFCIFYRCSSLTSVTIPNSVTNIGDYTFYGCSSMTDVTIPDTVTSIGENAFSGCSGLTDVYYGGSEPQWNAISLGTNNDDLNNATIHCEGDTPTTYTVTYNTNGGTGVLADQVKTHGVALTLSTDTPTHSSSSAGSYTVTLNANGGSVNPTSLTASRTTNYSFKNWNTAANGSGTSYASGATYSENADVTLYAQWNSNTTTEAVTLQTPTRDGYTFKGWNTSSSATSGVTGSYTPSGNVTLYAIWEETFVSSGTWGSLSWTLDANGLLTISGNGDMDNFNDSSTAAWRSKKSSVKSIIINSGITSIGDWAFNGCKYLKSVTIPESVTIIGEDAFSNCSGLTSVTIPEGVTSLSFCAFYGCSSLKSVTISESVTILGDYAFSGCKGLKSITIPENVTSIGEYAFYRCSGLTSVTIPGSVTSLGGDAFADCSGLTSVTIQEGVTSLGFCIFYRCSSLTSVTIPNSVTNIGDYTFYGCSSMTDVTIPDTVTSIGENAFSGCSGLTDVYYSGSPDQWEAIVISGGNSNLINATIHYDPLLMKPDFILPDALTEIGEEAFANCAFTYVKLSENTDTIGKNAFANCRNLKYIYIPEGCLWIDRYAFTGVTGLTILGVDGSYAKTYASGKGFDFIAVS